MTTELSLPSSLLQLHYHNRPGGVTTVMNGYARSFRRLNSPAPIGFFGHDMNSASYPNSPASLDVPQCDYAYFENVRSFEQTRKTLRDALTRHLLDPVLLPRPTAVVAHNLNLGRNMALSAAFADTALQMSGDDFRFYLIVHDFVEEGRWEPLRALNEMVAGAIDVWTQLYPEKGVAWYTINRRNRTVLRSAGIPAGIIGTPRSNAGNPIDTRSERGLASRPDSAENFALHIRALANRDHGTFHEGAPMFLYPVRVISRKNVLEAVIQACVTGRGNLLLGSPGTSEPDIAMYRRLRDFCRHKNLPVLFDCGRLRGFLPADLNVFHYLTRKSDACISTSVAEGFGYTLFEPWTLGTPVVGRRPLEFSPVAGAEFGFLYDRFAVPTDWVDLSALATKYGACLSQLHTGTPFPRSREAFEKDFRSEFVRNGRIDFGVLDTETQFEVLRRCVEGEPYPDIGGSGSIVSQLEEVNAVSQEGGSILDRNMVRLNDYFSDERFDREFASMLSTRSASQTGSRFECRSIRSYFGTLSRIRLLLAPPGY